MSLQNCLEFASTAENENVLEFFLNGKEFAVKTENENVSEIFLNWNESVAKTKKILSGKFLKIGMNLWLRRKMILSSNKLVELEVICG